ncbi:MAG: asparagine synthase (glutamine-hydrolyzing) [Planctomycetota bacterium]|jgi:asparagine synthase (glutamine-hydrolysing)
MCGIAGLFAHERGRVIDEAVVAAMTQSVAHRGPDGEGLRCALGYGLGHRRLAIVDLSGGAQPMGLPDGKLWVTFNGEIYNHLELRHELEARGCVFRTHSDTEVLLHGFRAWGTGLASRLRGMFAFAIVDEVAHTLYAARDRIGKKPFYWAERDGLFAFASELKGLHEFGIDRRLRPDAVGQFFALRYVPDPATIFASAHKLPPAHWCLLQNGKLKIERYWQVQFSKLDQTDLVQQQDRLLQLFDEAVRIRLMGEVPLLPFLSGGIDSYAVVDSMTRLLGHPVAACTIGFEDPQFDERPAARANALACGATLHEEVLTTAELLDLDWLAETFDEPFADSSALPTYHVCRLARRHVTVALSGDGGDESFAGYRRYLFDWREHQARSFLPASVWRGLGSAWPKLDWAPRPFRWKRTLENLGRNPAVAYARSVSSNLPEEVMSLLKADHHAAIGDPLRPVIAAYEAADGLDALARAAATDIATWLPGDILVKVDRASMATALEVRAPFLDQELVEFAAQISSARKMRGGTTKAFLRSALSRRLSPAALQRKKQGFSVPLKAWFRGPLGNALDAELQSKVLGEWIAPDVVRRLLTRHRTGVGDHSELLWAVLVFARFLRRWCQ